MPRVDPLYYALTRPVAPVGQAARGGSRLLSSLAPALMPMVDEYMDDPEVQSILSGWGKSAGDALGGEGSDISRLLEKAGPMMGRMAPRVGAAAGAEGLSLLGGALGAPEEMWDPGIRRQNMMMSMRMPGKGQPNTTGAGAGSDGTLGYEAPEMMDLSSPSGTGVEDIGGGMGIDWGASFAGANVRGAPSGLKEPGGGGNSGSQLGQAVGGAVGGPAAGAGLGMAFGAVEDLAKAPGSMFQKGTDAATSTDGLRKALAGSSSKPADAGNFGMRMGQFGPATTPDFAGKSALQFESKPTVAEAGLMPQAPNPLQQHVQMPPAVLAGRRPGGSPEPDDSTEEYTLPTQRVQGRGSSGFSPASTGSGGGAREYTPPAAIKRDYPVAQKSGGLTPPNSAARASDLLGALRPARPPAYESGVEEEQMNQTRERLRQPQMGIRYRR